VTGLALVLLLAGAGAATPTAAPPAGAREPSVLWLVGASYGAPPRLSGTCGVMVPMGAHRDQAAVVFSADADAQVGLAGGALRLGLDAWPHPSSSHWTLSVHAVAARTWGNPLQSDPGRTLLGADLEVSLAKLLWASVGVLAPVGAPAGAKTVQSWSAGVRFPIKCFTGCPF